MTFDPRAAFETRSIEYQPPNDIFDPNVAYEAANNEDFELSGRDPVLGGKLREKPFGWMRGNALAVHTAVQLLLTLLQWSLNKAEQERLDKMEIVMN